MEKYKSLLTTKNIIIALSLAVVLIFSGLVVYSRNNNLKNERDDRVTIVVNNEEPEIEIEEEINDGVYTNYTYGFSFEYDETIFTLEKNTGIFTKKWILNDGSDEISLRLLVNEPGDEYYNQQLELLFENIPNGNYSNLKDRSTIDNVSFESLGNYSLLTYRTNSKDSFEGEHFSEYVLLARKTSSPLISLSMISTTSKTLDSYKSEFELIKNTFKFN